MAKPLTLEEKKRIESLLAGGWTCHAAAGEIKRDHKTVKAYAETPGAVSAIKAARAELADLFEGLARRYVDSITPEDIKKINAYQRTIAAAAATDKMRLLRNESTANFSAFAGGIIGLIQAADKQYTKQLTPPDVVETAFTAPASDTQPQEGVKALPEGGRGAPPWGGGVGVTRKKRAAYHPQPKGGVK
jgi:hypothetical protein